jgi:hypothetical protein
VRLPGLRRSPARTTLLGVAALGVLIWAAVSQLGVDINSLIAQLILILRVIGALALLAGLLVVGVGLLRRRRRR